MFKSLGSVLIQNVLRREEKKEKPSTSNWESQVIEWALVNLKGFDLKLFSASMRGGDGERKKALELTGRKMKNAKADELVNFLSAARKLK